MKENLRSICPDGIRDGAEIFISCVRRLSYAVRRKMFALFGLLIIAGSTGCADRAESEAVRRDSIALKQNMPQNEEEDFGEIIDQDEGYTLYGNVAEGWYLYEIYDMEGNVIEEEEKFSCPHICMLSDDIVHVFVGAGTNVWFDWYYDRWSGEKSETYYTAIAREGRLIAYMELEESDSPFLVIRDVFDENLYYQKVKRNFDPDPISCSMIMGTFLDGSVLEITYYTDTQEEVTESIALFRELG